MNTTPVKTQQLEPVKLSDINYNVVMFKRKQMIERVEQRGALEALRETRGNKK